MTRRPGGAVGNEDFSSILAHFAGVGERPVRGQIGEYAEHGQSVLDSQRAIQESTELGQGDWGKPLAYLSGVTEGSPYGGIPSGTTEDDQRQLNEVRRPNEERESLQGRPEGVPMGESLQGRPEEVPMRESLRGRPKATERSEATDRREGVPSGATERREATGGSPNGRVPSDKVASGNETGGNKAKLALRVRTAPPNALSMAVLRRGGTEKEELSPGIRKGQPGGVRELLEKFSWRRGLSNGRAPVSGQLLRGGTAVKIAVQRKMGENAQKQGADAAQRETEGSRRLGVNARLRMAGEKGSGADHLTMRRTISESQETLRSLPIERDRITGGKEQVGGQRLPDTILSRYEESARSVDVKSNYQNLKNADGNFNEIVRQFNILVKNGGGEARMVLEPEHLGHLKLRIQLDRGEVTTNMVVDNQAVKELIMSRLNILEESLLKHGFGLGSFEVGVKGENAEGDRSSAKAQGRKGFSTVNPVDNSVPEESVQEQYLPWISSRVNITV
jgi:hypothetical protein